MPYQLCKQQKTNRNASSAHCHPRNLIQAFDANLLLRQVLENAIPFEPITTDSVTAFIDAGGKHRSSIFRELARIAAPPKKKEKTRNGVLYGNHLIPQQFPFESYADYIFHILSL